MEYSKLLARKYPAALLRRTGSCNVINEVATLNYYKCGCLQNLIKMIARSFFERHPIAVHSQNGRFFVGQTKGNNRQEASWHGF